MKQNREIILRKYLHVQWLVVIAIGLAMTATVEAGSLVLDDTVEGVMKFKHDANFEFGVTSQGVTFGGSVAGTTTTIGESGTFTGRYFVNSPGNPDPGSGVIYVVDSFDNNIISDIITASWSTSVQPGFDIATFTVTVQSGPTGTNLGQLSAVAGGAFIGLGVPETGALFGIGGLFRNGATAAPVQIPSNLGLFFGSVNDPVPEPGTIVLFGAVMAGFVAWRKRRRNSA